MANFEGDFSSGYIATPTLWATSTGVTTNTHATGVSVDLVDNVANIVSSVLVVGNAGGTSPTGSFLIQESTDGSSNWTSVTGGAFTQVTTHNRAEVISFQPTKRYLRSTGTVGGTLPVLETTILILAPRRHAPTNVGGFSLTAAAGN
jgi:hypothetical protein